MVNTLEKVSFQSTLPRGERRLTMYQDITFQQNFNPRSHEGSDALDVVAGVIIAGISIHAPTRGATYEYVDIYALYVISIHAPTRGATLEPTNIQRHVKFQSTLPRGERRPSGTFPIPSHYFNPRSHEGSDSELQQLSFYVDTISIHAPTRGATYNGDGSVTKWRISIHAPTRGATRWKYPYHYHGGYFNPRSHEGSDVGVEIDCWLKGRFQSTLPRGERQQFSPKSSLFSQQKLSKIFNLNNKLF